MMKAAALALLALLSLSAARDFYVSPDGDDESSDGLKREHAFSTLRKALDQADTDDVIHLLTGTYEGADNCGLEIKKSITIEGEGKTDPRQVIIKCANIADVNAFRIDMAGQEEHNVVSLRGFTVTMASATAMVVEAGVVNMGSLAFIDNLHGGDGGALYVKQQARVEMSDCHFERNQATNGGAIYSTGHITMTKNSFLVANFAKENGGAIYVDNGKLTIDNAREIENNWAGQRGGALYARKADLQMSYSSLHENQAEVAGGGLYVEDKTSLVAKQVDFLRNHAATVGGAVALDASEAIITHSDFHLCTSERGGAIAFMGGSKASLDSNEYSSNVATEQGGALYVESSEVSDSMQNSESYQFNTASYGGGIYVKHGTVLAQRANFANNTAVTEGGAIYAEESKVVLRVSTLMFNSGTTAGGILCDHSQVHLQHSHIGQNAPENLVCSNECKFAASESSVCTCDKCGDS